MLRPTGAHTSKGFGRMMKAFVQAPMEVSVGLTKGFHNFPKLWGDDTVRPQEHVRDFKSGAVAAGREFGYGWYDGVTGLVTQPWTGAQKEGATGFVKGFGKGIAGFATKPFAGFAGLLGHTMKGVQKEVQKLFGGNLQNYIVASRVAQGYEEWLQSSDAEKQDVIVRWTLVQRYLKKKDDPEQMMQDTLEAQRKKNVEETVVRQNHGSGANPAASSSTEAPTLYPESVELAVSGSEPSQESLQTADSKVTIRVPVQEASRRSVGEDGNVERAIEEGAPQHPRQLQEAADQDAEEQDLRQAMAESETEAQRHANEALELKKQLELVKARSLLEQ